MPEMTPEERAREHFSVPIYQQECAKAIHEAEAPLREENQRLRAALESVREYIHNEECHDDGWHHPSCREAQQALAGSSSALTERDTRMTREGAREDGERLDWLDTWLTKDPVWSCVLISKNCISSCSDSYCLQPEDGDLLFRPTIREAIDAAMGDRAEKLEKP